MFVAQIIGSSLSVFCHPLVYALSLRKISPFFYKAHQPQTAGTLWTVFVHFVQTARMSVQRPPRPHVHPEVSVSACLFQFFNALFILTPV